MSNKSGNAPVYYALAQLQFNPVIAMAKYIDEVQDLLRRRGYTHFEPQVITQLEITAGLGQAPTEPQVTHSHSWHFTKTDRTSGFVLTQAAITFHTTHYETRNEFIPELLNGFEAVHKIVKLDHINRIGLRYLDAVLPLQNESVDEYIAAGLRGINFSKERRYELHESVFDTETGPLITKGIMVARVHKMKSLLGYPPDITPKGLAAMPRFEMQEPMPHAVIDTDHYVEGKIPVEVDPIREQLFNLHAKIKEVFNATITDHAREIWQVDL